MSTLQYLMGENQNNATHYTPYILGHKLCIIQRIKEGPAGFLLDILAPTASSIWEKNRIRAFHSIRVMTYFMTITLLTQV